MRDSAVKRWSKVHTWLFRLSRGRIGKRLVDNDMLLLTTKGHVSGKAHTVPLLYLEDEGSLVVIASYGGRPTHPDWYTNLIRHPEVEVQVGDSRHEMRARVASDEERQHWWPRIVAAYDGYATYQGRTERQIPVVFLESL